MHAPTFAATLAATVPPPQAGIGTLLALVIFILASMWIGALANRAMKEGSFMKGFFLGNRGLGSWALALTATVQSGGTFMGFPSLVYSHGWIVAVWMSGYMVVPITGFGFLGKRLAQLSRRTGAITVPDMFRARFASPALGLTASLMIMFYMSFMMVAQFKAGALVMKLSWPGTGALALSEDLPEETAKEQAAKPSEEAAKPKPKGMGKAYFIGLAVFSITVVGYTLLGGFLAAVWTDLFQSVMMLVGVVILLILALANAGGLERATLDAVAATGPGYVFGPGYDPAGEGRLFLPLGLAVSFFFVWVYAGVGSPAGMVRIMASENTTVIRRSIFLLAAYNSMIYIPLVIICICGRALIPDLPPENSDEIIPRMALTAPANLPGGTFIGGLILAAPFGAIMATVSSYLVVIASGLVRDVYQRFFNPEATPYELRRLSYIVMIVVGAVAVGANIEPVKFLQAIVIFSGTGAAATFLIPALMLAYWRRATVPGMLASMLCGAGTLVVLYLLGFNGVGKDVLIGGVSRFRPYFLLGLDPLLWGLLASSTAGIGVSLATEPPDAALVSELFDAQPTTVKTLAPETA